MSGPEVLTVAGIALAALAGVCAALSAQAYRLLDIRGVRADLAGCGKARTGERAGAAKAAAWGLCRPLRALEPEARRGHGEAGPNTGLRVAAGLASEATSAAGGGDPACFVVMHKEIVASRADGLEDRHYGN